MNRENIIKTVVDIGSGRIKAIVGELSSDGNSLKVLKYKEVESKGVLKGEIVDSQEVSEILDELLTQLGEELEIEIEKITISINGKNIESRTAKVEFQLETEREIIEADIEGLISEAEKKLLTSEEKILKTEIYNMRVDNSGIVKNPLGLMGSKLQGDVHLICTNKSIISKVVSTVNRAKVDVEGLLVSGYAASKAVLSREDKQMGVAFVDIGEGTTDIILYKNEKIIYTESIPIGGMHFKSDLKYIFKLNDDNEAMEILNKYRKKDWTPEGNIYYNSGKIIEVLELENLINARIDDMITHIDNTIKKSGFNGYLGKGLVLTGGVIEDELIQIDKLIEKINKKTTYIARKVLPIEFRGLEQVNSSMATVIGLFYEVMEEENKKIKSGNYISSTVQNEKEKNNSNVREFEKELEDYSKTRESKKTEKSVLIKVKEWFNNFI